MEHIELYDRIIESYQSTNSVKKTAEELGTSVIKVRKVLITEGLWSSPTSQKIMELIEQGLSTKEIAERLNYTEKNVQAFSPYTKGDYGRENKSSYSLRSKEYRERNQLAAEKQVSSGAIAQKEFVRTEALPEHYGNRPIALKLHLELDLGECSEDEIAVLRKHGKMKSRISRDIIIPADMTLHAIHYAIQKLFGWQNSHLHHFEFPEAVFEELTQGSFSRWCSLAGIYFRFPEEELDDLYWDDDYEPNVSVKSWLRSKYTGPFSYGGLGDYYYENQRKVRALKTQLPSFEVRQSFQEFMKNDGKGASKEKKVVAIEDATIEEFCNSIELGGELTHLLERMTLMEYLYLPNNDYFLDTMDDKIRFYEDGLDVSLRMWESVFDGTNENYELFCQLVALSTVRMQAKSNQLNYFYDYGDGWEVSIQLKEAYYGDSIEQPDSAAVRSVISNHTPICVEADGLPVLDDVGGIHGYVDFLVTAHYSADDAEREEAREWARSLGWTGRANKPHNIL